ncbi:MAG: sulfatase [Planctomycetes bacterium]|nr:sulfatase [Planctomycetota bacterium]
MAADDPQLTRRGFLAGVGGMLAATRLRGLAARAAGDFDHLVLVCIDDLNDWCSVLRGHPNARTPNIDRIAAAGTIFTDAHVAAPICNPSRTATYFGMSPRSSGVYFNGQDWRECKRLADKTSLFRHLRAGGIETVGMGKVHHMAYQDPESWDRFVSSKEVPLPRREYPFRWYLTNEGENIDWGAIPDDEREFRLFDDEVCDEALVELERLRQGKGRFALNVGFYRPHLPWFVPQRYYDLFPLEDIVRPFQLEGDLDDVPEIGRLLARHSEDERIFTELEATKRAIRAYLASIAYVDEKVGRLFDAWRAWPGHERGLFVLWSDNGFHLGEKEAWRKFTLWHESTRVPFIFVAPGLTPAGSFCRRPVSLLSLYPTLCDLLGRERPAQLEAPSLVPLLRDPEAAWTGAAVSVLGRSALAIRDEHWCYIRYRDGEEELYARERDPGEYQNLAPARAAELKRDLLRRAPAEAAPYDPQKGSELARQLGLED